MNIPCYFGGEGGGGGELEVQASKGVIMIDNWCHLLASPKIGMLLGGNRSLFYCEEHDDSLILLIVTNMMIPSEFEKMRIFFVLLKIRMAKK